MDLGRKQAGKFSEYMDISRPADYFIACYAVLTRPNKIETAVHGCNSWLSVWTLSCRCPVKVSIRPTRFLWFWYLYNIYKCIQTKKTEFQCFFAMKSSFKFSASVTPNEVDPVMEDWCRRTSLQEHLKA